MDNATRCDKANGGGCCAEPEAAGRLEQIRHDRGKVYGEPKLNHELIAGHWAGILQPWWERISKGESLPPHVVALLMAGLKLNRTRLVYHEDNFDDMLVYLDFAKEWQRMYDWNDGDGKTPARERDERDMAPGMREVDEAIDIWNQTSSWQSLVRDFRIKFKHGVGFTMDQYRHSGSLIEEEHHELLCEIDELKGLRGTMDESEAKAKCAAECVDLIYVLLGLAVELDIELDPIFRAIHAKNMEKEPAINGGKPVKPKGWSPVDVAAMVREQWYGKKGVK